MLINLLPDTVTIYRKSDELLSSGSVSGLTITTYQPAVASKLVIRLQEATAFGTVIVHGTDSSGITSENFVYSKNKFVQGAVNFLSVSGLSFSGISDGSVTVKTVSGGGSSKFQLLAVASSVKGRIRELKTTLNQQIPGREVDPKYRLYMTEEDGPNVRALDLVWNSSAGLTYQIERRAMRQNSLSDHHLEFDMTEVTQ